MINTFSDTLKDSGIEWIGQIPNEWKVTKIGQIYDERNEKVSDKDYPPLSVTKNGVVPQLETAAKTDNGDNRKLVRINDFVINSRSDRRGSCGISEYEGSVSLINTVLSPRNNMCNKYYNYTFKSECFADEFYKWGNGIVDDLWSTKWSSMKNIYIPFPEIEEQKKIADYLDDKCNKIDNIIETEKAVIERLKEYKQSLITESVTKGSNKSITLKNSNIKWIGEIPEHWKVLRIKNVAWLKGRIGWQGLKSDEYQDTGAYLITGTDFDNGRINWDTCVHISQERFEEAPEIHIKENDLLITKDGTVGKVALAINCPQDVSLNSGVLLIRNTKDIKYHSKYLYYMLLSDVFWQWFNSNLNGNSTIIHLYQEQFYDFSFCYPPIDEQEQIANYLDKKCTEIDKAIEDKEQVIEKFAEYKKSLIYECVTGKKRI